MILTGEDAAMAMWHMAMGRKRLMAGGRGWIFYHDGERFGPFGTRDHARFVQWHLGCREELVEAPLDNRTAREDCKESVTE